MISTITNLQAFKNLKVKFNFDYWLTLSPYFLASTVLWSEESLRVRWENVCENPVVTLPKKKRINTELFIDRTAALNIGEIWIRVATNEGDQQIGSNRLEELEYTFHRNAIMT